MFCKSCKPTQSTARPLSKHVYNNKVCFDVSFLFSCFFLFFLSPFWDIIVMTATDAPQAASYESQLQVKQDLKEIPKTK